MTWKYLLKFYTIMHEVELFKIVGIQVHNMYCSLFDLKGLLLELYFYRAEKRYHMYIYISYAL